MGGPPERLRGPVRDRDRSPRLSARGGRGAQAARRGEPGRRLRAREGAASARDSADEEPCHLFATRTRHSGPPSDPRTSRRRCDGQPDDRAAPRRASDVARARPLPDAVRRARRRDRRCGPAPGVPALSPDGDRVAYVTDRSGIPRLEVAAARRRDADGAVRARRGGRLGRLVPGRRPGWPTWSAPAARSAPSCTSSGPTAPATAWSPGEDPRATVFAGGWTGPGLLRLLDRPRRRAGRRHRAGRRGHRRAPHARHRRLPVGHRGVGRRAVRAGPPRPPRATGTSSSIDVATGEQRRVLALGRPGRRRLRGRPVRRRRPLGLRARLAARRARSPTGPGSSRSRCPTTACPGGARVVLARPDADLDGYALRTDGTLLAVWNAGGVTELLVHAARRRLRGAADRAAGAGDAGLVAVGRRRDDGRRADRPAAPARPVGRADHRRRRPGAAALGAAAPGPGAAGDPGAARLRRARRAAAVGLALHAAAGPRPEPHRGQLPRRPGGAGAAELVARSRRAWSPPGSPSSRRTCAARAGSAARS